jgi:hypothetical protein
VGGGRCEGGGGGREAGEGRREVGGGMWDVGGREGGSRTCGLEVQALVI